MLEPCARRDRLLILRVRRLRLPDLNGAARGRRVDVDGGLGPGHLGLVKDCLVEGDLVAKESNDAAACISAGRVFFE